MKSRIFFLLIVILACVLRLYKLGTIPPGLNWDEASLGYNSYSILTSGKDEHGEFFPLARFIAFGDYKPPGYIYFSVPFIFLFSLTEFAIRFPSTVAGIIMVILTYYLTLEISKRTKIALLASFLLSISPWSLQMSRAAFEANLAAMFNLGAVYFFLKSPRKPFSIIISVILFMMSFYTFNANRIIAPLMFLGLIVIHNSVLKNYRRFALISFLIIILMIIPSISYLGSPESKLRLQEVSIFNNLEPLIQSNTRIAREGNTLLARLIHNRRLYYAKSYLKHYFDNFKGGFLFNKGDVNPRLSLQNTGELYFWDLPFFLIGIYYLIKKKSKNYLVLLLWMAAVPIPAGLAKETPHALRIVSILPTYQIITAVGLFVFMNFIKTVKPLLKMIVILTVGVFLMGNIYYYLHEYYIHYPLKWNGEWQSGYKELVTYIEANQSQYQKIYVPQALGRPYIFFAFFGKYPTKKLLAEKIASRDWYGFWTVHALDNIQFSYSEVNPYEYPLLVVKAEKDAPQNMSLVKKINDYSGKTIFHIFSNK